MMKKLSKRKAKNMRLAELYNIECDNAGGNGTCNMNPAPSNSFVSCTVIPAIKGWISK